MSKKNEYYDIFTDMAETGVKAVLKLEEIFNNFTPEKVPVALEEMHVIEEDCDKKKHNLMNILSRDFVTPIEREDIIALSSELDTVVDAIEDVVIKTYMYNVQTIRPEALEIVDIIHRCTNKIVDIMKEFPNFRKSKTLGGTIREVNSLEESGDRIYIQAVRLLYTSDEPSKNVVGWTEIYYRLERCCDACEHAVDVVESIIMKNI